MDFDNLIGLFVSIAIFGYLAYCLFRPEDL